MTKKILILFLVVMNLVSCGLKKRTTTKKHLRTKNVVENSRSHDKPTGYEDLPDYGENFISFEVSSVEEYIRTFSEMAQAEMKSFGIPASITLAQGILESGSGQGELAKKTNNHFGIKCHKGWYGEYELHDDDEKGECFRKYVHPMLSFRDHSLFLVSRSRYSALFKLRSDDYVRWAKGLKEAGYATDRKYPQKLIALIERYELYRFDNVKVSKNEIAQAVGNHPTRTMTHVVSKGDTLYSISQKYFVTVDEIMKWNNMKSTVLAIGQKLMVKTQKPNP
jgi:flagellum-specific peptidoglycan hydrolase FlgJ